MIARAKALLQNETVWRFVKFLVVGGLNTAFGYAVYALLVLLGQRRRSKPAFREALLARD